MPPATEAQPIDREAVRTLAVAVGVREAARQLNLDENRVLQWSHRGQWFKQPEPTQQPPTVSKHDVISVIKPSQALQNVMEQRKSKSRLLLSKYVLNATKVASRSRSPLRDAQSVRHVAAVHSSIWPEQAGSTNVQINLAIGIGGVE